MEFRVAHLRSLWQTHRMSGDAAPRVTAAPYSAAELRRYPDSGKLAAAGGRRRPFLLTRYAVIIAVGGILVAYGSEPGRLWPIVVVAAAVGSNLLLHQIPERVLFAWWFLAPLLLADTAWIAGSLLVAGVGEDAFLFYFIVLFLAALGENLVLLVTGAVLLGAVSVALHPGSGPTGPTLIRIPFFFATALFYGHLIQLARTERTRSEREHQLAERLEREVRRRTEELRRQRAEASHLYHQLVEAQRARAEFVANTSHELRTPLNSIIGYADLLAEERAIADNPDLAEMVRRIANSGRALHHLVENVLAFARLERGEGTVLPTRFPLRRLLNDLRSLASELPVPEELEVRIEGPEAEVLETDYARVQSILSNLLMNAIKFTRRGKVVLSGEVGREQVTFRVEDTGVGMDPATLERAFMPFEQGDGSPRRAFGGVGLGLAVVRRNVDLLGGHLEVHSIPGRGSVFTVSLPRVAKARLAAQCSGGTVTTP